MKPYDKPLPRPDDLANAPYWTAARNGELKMQCCTGCGRFRFPAAPICPHCRARGAQWTATSGTGVIESYCRFHKAYWPGFDDGMPYSVVQVLLDNGVRLYSNLLGVADGEIRIGAAVEPCFDEVTPEVTLVRFRYRDAGAQAER